MGHYSIIEKVEQSLIIAISGEMAFPFANFPKLSFSEVSGI